MTTLVVSQASLDEQGAFGSASVVNTRLSVAPVGFDSFAASLRRLLVADQSALYIDLTSSVGSELPVRLDFDPVRPIPVRGLDSFSPGQHIVENAAQAAYLLGAYNFHVGRIFVYSGAVENNPVFFDLIDVLASNLALQFPLGATALLVAAKGFDSSVIQSPEEVEATLQIHVDEFDSFGVGRLVRVSDLYSSGRLLEFDFIVGVIPESPVRLDFDSVRPIPVRGLDSFSPGQHIVENAAQAAYPLGVDSLYIHRLFVYPKDIQNNPIYFNLFNFIPGDSALNIQFPFGEAKVVLFNGSGADSFTSGTHVASCRALINSFDSLAFGAANARCPYCVLCVGFESSEFGVTRLPFVFLGFESFISGSASLILLSPPSTQLVDLRDGLGVYKNIYGTTFVSNYLRYLFEVGEIYTHTYGDLWVSFYRRAVQVSPFNDFSRFAIPQVGFHQVVYHNNENPFTHFGDALVDIVSIKPVGLESFIADSFFVDFYIRRLQVFSVDFSGLGESLVYNLRQYVSQVTDCTNTDTWCGVRFGASLVYNRNRVVAVYGTPFLRFASTPFIVGLGGRDLHPVGVSSLSIQAIELTSHRIRRVFPSAVYDFYASRFLQVYNAAAQVKPFSWVSFVSSHDATVVTDRYLAAHSSSSLQFGIGWVSRSPRYLGFVTAGDQGYFFKSSDFMVSYTPLYVAFVGHDSAFVMTPNLYARPIPTIVPRWMETWRQDRLQIGEPRVWNLTPQVWMAPIQSLETSRQMVSFRIRYCAVEGFSLFVGSLFAVKDRKQFIIVPGQLSFAVSSLFDVRNTSPDPPSLQVINVAAIFVSDTFKLGRAFVYANSVLFEIPHAFTDFGDGYVFNGGVFVDTSRPVLGLTEWGSLSVLGGRKVITFVSYPPRTDTMFFVSGKPSVEPYTIWMRLDAPSQAVFNHNNTRFELVDADTPYGFDVGPWFGELFVSGGEGRRVYIHGFEQLLVEDEFLRVGLKLRRILFEGKRFTVIRFPTVLSPTTRIVKPFGEEFSKLGVASLRYGGAYQQTISVEGASLFSIALPWVSLWVQNIYLAGDSFTVYGDNNPMVHYPRVLQFSGGSQTQYGVTWVDFAVRSIYMIGEESFVSEATSFRRRMRVENKIRYINTYPYVDMLSLGAVGINLGPGKIIVYGRAAPCIHQPLHITIPDYDRIFISGVSSLAISVFTKITLHVGVTYIEPSSCMGDRGFVGATGGLTFDLSVATTNSGLPVRFDYTEAVRPINAKGSCAAVYGSHIVENTALSVYVGGSEFWRVGISHIGGVAVFDFASSLSAVYPVRLDFDVNRPVPIRGFDSSVLGGCEVAAV